MTRARDIAGGTIFTGADHTKLDGIATGATAYVHPTGAGNQHVPAAGAAGQLLQYASAGTAAWATVSSGTPELAFPSDWLSPNNTYASSATWSKGSLADEDFVWFYLVNGGYGGGRANSGQMALGGYGGGGTLILGKAKVFHGCAMVVGAAGAGATTGNYGGLGTAGGITSITLSSANGSTVFQSSTTIKEASIAFSTTSGVVAGQQSNLYNYTITSPVTISGVSRQIGLAAHIGGDINTIFGASAGQRSNHGVGGGWHAATTSLYAGNGGSGNSSLSVGIYPGGGGNAGYNANGAAGAAGNIRVYHV